MANTIQEAQGALEQLRARQASIVERQDEARTRQANAGDDVDAHVNATMEIAGCDAALKHLAGQIAEVEQRLQAAQREENQRQAQIVRAELEKDLAAIVAQVEPILAQVKAPELDGKIERLGLLGERFNLFSERRRKIVEPLERLLQDAKGYSS